MKRATPNAIVHDRRGFTLLEAVISMAILTAGILAVCAMQTLALRTSTVAYDRTEANSIATALIECFQSLPYSALKVTTDPDDKNKKYLPSTADSGDEDDYNYYVKGESDRLDKLMERLIESVAAGDVPADERRVIPGDDGWVRVVNGAQKYVLKWAVQEEKEKVNDADKSIRKNIRVFLDWKTPMGRNHLVFTTTKYPNMAQ